MTECTLKFGRHEIGLSGEDTVNITINGRLIGAVDFHPLTEGDGPLQLVIDGGPGDTTLVKILFPDGHPPTVIVHQDAAELRGGEHPNSINHGTGDHVFVGVE